MLCNRRRLINPAGRTMSCEPPRNGPERLAPCAHRGTPLCPHVKPAANLRHFDLYLLAILVTPLVEDQKYTHSHSQQLTNYQVSLCYSGNLAKWHVTARESSTTGIERVVVRGIPFPPHFHKGRSIARAREVGEGGHPYTDDLLAINTV